MPRLRYSANRDRSPVRLISTPNTASTPEESVMTTLVEGIKFSDQTAALLLHAVDNGWRLEPKGVNATAGVTAYSPDKTQRPISVTERAAKFNKIHYDNLRREMHQAGLPPMPGDDEKPLARVEATPATDTKKPGVSFVDSDTGHEVEAEELGGVMSSGEAPQALEALVAAITGSSKYVTEADAALIGEVAAATMAAVMTRGLTARRDELGELEAALQMASEQEANAARLAKQVKKLEAELLQARKDCKQALEEKREAVARADAADRALAPLRAYLGASDAPKAG